jgi:hypothetical protein
VIAQSKSLTNSRKNAKTNHHNSKRRAFQGHQPITKRVAIQNSTREKIAKDRENFSPSILSQEESYVMK